MKSALLTLVLFSNLSLAGDLESELSKQTVTKISPVTYKGANVCDLFDSSTASGICTMLGYSRVVSYKFKEQSSTKFAFIREVVGFGGGAREIAITELPIDSYRSCYDEVVCAR